MATKKAASSPASKTARTTSKTAGKPVQETPARPRSGGGARRAGTTPTAAELDLRDRMKAQPRRAAGPPLVGDVVSQAALKALSNEVLPAPTDPKGRSPRAKRS